MTMMRSPLLVTVDTGAVQLAITADSTCACDPPCDEPLLIIPSCNELLTIAGTEREIEAFAYGLLSAIMVYNITREDVEQ